MERKISCRNCACGIVDKKYDIDMTAKGINAVIKYGVAFSGKNVKIVMEAIK